MQQPNKGRADALRRMVFRIVYAMILIACAGPVVAQDTSVDGGARPDVRAHFADFGMFASSIGMGAPGKAGSVQTNANVVFFIETLCELSAHSSFNKVTAGGEPGPGVPTECDDLPIAALIDPTELGKMLLAERNVWVNAANLAELAFEKVPPRVAAELSPNSAAAFSGSKAKDWWDRSAPAAAQALDWIGREWIAAHAAEDLSIEAGRIDAAFLRLLRQESVRRFLDGSPDFEHLLAEQSRERRLEIARQYSARFQAQASNILDEILTAARDPVRCAELFSSEDSGIDPAQCESTVQKLRAVGAVIPAMNDMDNRIVRILSELQAKRQTLAQISSMATGDLKGKCFVPPFKPAGSKKDQLALLSEKQLNQAAEAIAAFIKSCLDGAEGSTVSIHLLAKRLATGSVIRDPVSLLRWLCGPQPPGGPKTEPSPLLSSVFELVPKTSRDILWPIEGSTGEVSSLACQAIVQNPDAGAMDILAAFDRLVAAELDEAKRQALGAVRKPLEALLSGNGLPADAIRQRIGDLAAASAAFAQFPDSIAFDDSANGCASSEFGLSAGLDEWTATVSGDSLVVGVKASLAACNLLKATHPQGRHAANSDKEMFTAQHWPLVHLAEQIDIKVVIAGRRDAPMTVEELTKILRAEILRRAEDASRQTVEKAQRAADQPIKALLKLHGFQENLVAKALEASNLRWTLQPGSGFTLRVEEPGADGPAPLLCLFVPWSAGKAMAPTGCFTLRELAAQPALLLGTKAREIILMKIRAELERHLPELGNGVLPAAIIDQWRWTQSVDSLVAVIPEQAVRDAASRALGENGALAQYLRGDMSISINVSSWDVAVLNAPTFDLRSAMAQKFAGWALNEPDGALFAVQQISLADDMRKSRDIATHGQCGKAPLAHIALGPASPMQGSLGIVCLLPGGGLKLFPDQRVVLSTRDGAWRFNVLSIQHSGDKLKIEAAFEGTSAAGQWGGFESLDVTLHVDLKSGAWSFPREGNEDAYLELEQRASALLPKGLRIAEIAIASKGLHIKLAGDRLLEQALNEAFDRIPEEMIATLEQGTKLAQEGTCFARDVAALHKMLMTGTMTAPANAPSAGCREEFSPGKGSLRPPFLGERSVLDWQCRAADSNNAVLESCELTFPKEATLCGKRLRFYVTNGGDKPSVTLPTALASCLKSHVDALLPELGNVSLELGETVDLIGDCVSGPSLCGLNATISIDLSDTLKRYGLKGAVASNAKLRANAFLNFEGTLNVTHDGGGSLIAEVRKELEKRLAKTAVEGSEFADEIAMAVESARERLERLLPGAECWLQTRSSAVADMPCGNLKNLISKLRTDPPVALVLEKPVTLFELTAKVRLIAERRGQNFDHQNFRFEVSCTECDESKARLADKLARTMERAVPQNELITLSYSDGNATLAIRDKTLHFNGRFEARSGLLQVNTPLELDCAVPLLADASYGDSCAVKDDLRPVLAAAVAKGLQKALLGAGDIELSLGLFTFRVNGISAKRDAIEFAGRATFLDIAEDMTVSVSLVNGEVKPSVKLGDVIGAKLSSLLKGKIGDLFGDFLPIEIVRVEPRTGNGLVPEGFAIFSTAEIKGLFKISVPTLVLDKRGLHVDGGAPRELTLEFENVEIPAPPFSICPLGGTVSEKFVALTADVTLGLCTAKEALAFNGTLTVHLGKEVGKIDTLGRLTLLQFLEVARSEGKIDIKTPLMSQRLQIGGVFSDIFSMESMSEIRGSPSQLKAQSDMRVFGVSVAKGNLLIPFDHGGSIQADFTANIAGFLKAKGALKTKSGFSSPRAEASASMGVAGFTINETAIKATPRKARLSFTVLGVRLAAVFPGLSRINAGLIADLIKKLLTPDFKNIDKALAAILSGNITINPLADFGSGGGEAMDGGDNGDGDGGEEDEDSSGGEEGDPNAGLGDEAGPPQPVTDQQPGSPTPGQPAVLLPPGSDAVRIDQPTAGQDRFRIMLLSGAEGPSESLIASVPRSTAIEEIARNGGTRLSFSKSAYSHMLASTLAQSPEIPECNGQQETAYVFAGGEQGRQGHFELCRLLTADGQVFSMNAIKPDLRSLFATFLDALGNEMAARPPLAMTEPERLVLRGQVLKTERVEAIVALQRPADALIVARADVVDDQKLCGTSTADKSGGLRGPRILLISGLTAIDLANSKLIEEAILALFNCPDRHGRIDRLVDTFFLSAPNVVAKRDPSKGFEKLEVEPRKTPGAETPGWIARLEADAVETQRLQEEANEAEAEREKANERPPDGGGLPGDNKGSGEVVTVKRNDNHCEVRAGERLLLSFAFGEIGDQDCVLAQQTYAFVAREGGIAVIAGSADRDARVHWVVANDKPGSHDVGLRFDKVSGNALRLLNHYFENEQLSEWKTISKMVFEADHAGLWWGDRLLANGPAGLQELSYVDESAGAVGDLKHAALLRVVAPRKVIAATTHEDMTLSLFAKDDGPEILFLGHEGSWLPLATFDDKSRLDGKTRKVENGHAQRVRKKLVELHDGGGKERTGWRFAHGRSEGVVLRGEGAATDEVWWGEGASTTGPAEDQGSTEKPARLCEFFKYVEVSVQDTTARETLIKGLGLPEDEILKILGWMVRTGGVTSSEKSFSDNSTKSTSFRFVDVSDALKAAAAECGVDYQNFKGADDTSDTYKATLRHDLSVVLHLFPEAGKPAIVETPPVEYAKSEIGGFDLLHDFPETWVPVLTEAKSGSVQIIDSARSPADQRQIHLVRKETVGTSESRHIIRRLNADKETFGPLATISISGDGIPLDILRAMIRDIEPKDGSEISLRADHKQVGAKNADVFLVPDGEKGHLYFRSEAGIRSIGITLPKGDLPELGAVMAFAEAKPFPEVHVLAAKDPIPFVLAFDPGMGWLLFKIDLQGAALGSAVLAPPGATTGSRAPILAPGLTELFAVTMAASDASFNSKQAQTPFPFDGAIVDNRIGAIRFADALPYAVFRDNDLVALCAGQIAANNLGLLVSALSKPRLPVADIARLSAKETCAGGSKGSVHFAQSQDTDPSALVHWWERNGALNLAFFRPANGELSEVVTTEPLDASLATMLVEALVAKQASGTEPFIAAQSPPAENPEWIAFGFKSPEGASHSEEWLLAFVTGQDQSRFACVVGNLKLALRGQDDQVLPDGAAGKIIADLRQRAARAAISHLLSSGGKSCPRALDRTLVLVSPSDPQAAGDPNLWSIWVVDDIQASSPGGMPPRRTDLGIGNDSRKKASIVPPSFTKGTYFHTASFSGLAAGEPTPTAHIEPAAQEIASCPAGGFAAEQKAKSGTLPDATVLLTQLLKTGASQSITLSLPGAVAHCLQAYAQMLVTNLSRYPPPAGILTGKTSMTLRLLNGTVAIAQLDGAQRFLAVDVGQVRPAAVLTFEHVRHAAIRPELVAEIIASFIGSDFAVVPELEFHARDGPAGQTTWLAIRTDGGDEGAVHAKMGSEGPKGRLGSIKGVPDSLREAVIRNLLLHVREFQQWTDEVSFFALSDSCEGSLCAGGSRRNWQILSGNGDGRLEILLPAQVDPAKDGILANITVKVAAMKPPQTCAWTDILNDGSALMATTSKKACRELPEIALEHLVAADKSGSESVTVEEESISAPVAHYEALVSDLFAIVRSGETPVLAADTESAFFGVGSIQRRTLAITANSVVLRMKILTPGVPAVGHFKDRAFPAGRALVEKGEIFVSDAPLLFLAKEKTFVVISDKVMALTDGMFQPLGDLSDVELAQSDDLRAGKVEALFEAAAERGVRFSGRLLEMENAELALTGIGIVEKRNHESEGVSYLFAARLQPQGQASFRVVLDGEIEGDESAKAGVLNLAAKAASGDMKRDLFLIFRRDGHFVAFAVNTGSGQLAAPFIGSQGGAVQQLDQAAWSATVDGAQAPSIAAALLKILTDSETVRAVSGNSKTPVRICASSGAYHVLRGRGGNDLTPLYGPAAAGERIMLKVSSALRDIECKGDGLQDGDFSRALDVAKKLEKDGLMPDLDLIRTDGEAATTFFRRSGTQREFVLRSDATSTKCKTVGKGKGVKILIDWLASKPTASCAVYAEPEKGVVAVGSDGEGFVWVKAAEEQHAKLRWALSSPADVNLSESEATALLAWAEERILDKERDPDCPANELAWFAEAKQYVVEGHCQIAKADRNGSQSVKIATVTDLSGSAGILLKDVVELIGATSREGVSKRLVLADMNMALVILGSRPDPGQDQATFEAIALAKDKSCQRLNIFASPDKSLVGQVAASVDAVAKLGIEHFHMRVTTLPDSSEKMLSAFSLSSVSLQDGDCLKDPEDQAYERVAVLFPQDSAGRFTVLDLSGGDHSTEILSLDEDIRANNASAIATARNLSASGATSVDALWRTGDPHRHYFIADNEQKMFLQILGTACVSADKRTIADRLMELSRKPCGDAECAITDPLAALGGKNFDDPLWYGFAFSRDPRQALINNLETCS